MPDRRPAREDPAAEPWADPRLWMGLNRPLAGPGDVYVGIVGAPYDGSVSHEPGAAGAPGVLRRLSAGRRPHTENRVSLAGLRVRDFGDAAVDQSDPESTQRAITRAVSPLVQAGAIPLVLGGDHSITAAVVAAFPPGRELGVLWVDAHPDLMDSYKGIGGRVESKWNHACPLRRIVELPHVSPERVLVLGVRDFIPAELEYAEQQGIRIVHCRELSRMPVEDVVELIGRHFAGAGQVYISVDIDVLDPAHAPGTGVPIPGGLSSRMLLDLLYGLFDAESQALATTGTHFLPIAGFDLVEIAPPLDYRDTTSIVGLELIVAMLGTVALQLGVAGFDRLPSGGGQ